MHAAVSTAQVVTVSSGTVHRLENFPSLYVDPRNVDVWLPEGYSPRKNYAVLYMQDGQVLFDSTSSWNGQEWGVDETLGRLMQEEKIRDCIVVGIWNNGEKRMAEYVPQQALKYLDETDRAALEKWLPSAPSADNYLRFLVNELMPFIDSAYATLPDPSNTLIAGSSFGGLISLYALCEYPGVFGGAACLSTHWPVYFSNGSNPVPDAILKYLADYLPSPKNHRVYFDCGTATLDSLYAPYQTQVDAVMKNAGYHSKNWQTRVFPEADHSENAWRRRFEVPALFLLKP